MFSGFSRNFRAGFAWCLLLLIQVSSLSAQDGDRSDRAVYETEIKAPVGEVWKAFTTRAGLEAWMAPRVDIDLKVGGTMRANYDPKGKIGDDNTIGNTILAYDPERMLALKATTFPKGFPFAAAARSTWSVFYFSKVAPQRTKITVVGLGYTSDKQSQQMRRFFAAANAQSFAKLRQALEGKAARTPPGSGASDP